jgi:predicted molibdopterin-dependent oxidoreductase YjgC
MEMARGRKSRLTTPLVRRDGELQPATWEVALEIAATGLSRVKADHGGGALAVMSCSKATNETNYLAQKYARTVLGTNSIDSCNRT